MLLLICYGLFLCLRKREFRKANALLLGWIGSFFLCFSYFDNHNLRFSKQAYAPLVFLGLAALRELLRSATWQPKKAGSLAS